MLAVTLFTFNFAVSDALAAQATLSWGAPTNYAGGATIQGFVGYNLYIGTASGSYTQKLNVGNLTSYTVTNLAAGSTYYFVLTAYDSMGNESGPSSEVSTGSTSPPPASLYTVTASAGTGGSISPNGATVVSSGGSQSYTITPAAGYRIAGVSVDGASVGAVSAYSFSNLLANHTIAATFGAATTYSISASAGTGGSITPAGATVVSSGGSQSYTITAATGYKIAGVTVDGASIGAVSSYTFSNVAASHTIAATFTAPTSANIAHTGWTLKYVDSQELVGQNGAATNAFDGSTGTLWHTKWYNVSPVPPCPHQIRINLGKAYTLTGFSYLPRQDGGINGTIANYEFAVSSDDVNYTVVATGTWANNTQLKSVSFAARSGQYIRLRALSEVNGGPWTSAAEINVAGY